MSTLCILVKMLKIMDGSLNKVSTLTSYNERILRGKIKGKNCAIFAI